LADSYEYLVRAKALADVRRAAEAREAVDWALAHAEGDDVDVLVLAGVILLMLGDAHAALSVALRAVQAEPDAWEPQVLIADASRFLERIPDAVAAGRRAVALAPDEAEAQVALWRALAEVRTFTGVPRQTRAELAATARRAEELGADPEQFTKPRLWLKLIPFLAAFGLIRFTAGWTLVAVLAIGALLGAALWLLQARRSGATASGRVQSMRALARTELAHDPAKSRTAVLNITGFLPALPFAATAFPCAAGSDGDPWSTWSVTFAAGGAVVVLLLAARAVRWWYGEEFFRNDLLPSRVTVLHLGAVTLLVGGTLAFSLTGTTSTGWWLALVIGHFLWFFAGLGLSVGLLARDQRRRGALPRG
jgi:hypothetical protein